VGRILGRRCGIPGLQLTRLTLLNVLTRVQERARFARLYLDGNSSFFLAGPITPPLLAPPRGGALMTQRSAASTEMARRLWARAADDISAPEEVAAAAERMCTQLRTGLGRWVGTMGYRALFDRALMLAQAEHPALRSLACGADEPVTTADVRAEGTDEVAAGVVALVAALTEVLGRIIGEEMAVRLVEQAGIDGEREERPKPRGAVSTEPSGGRDARVG
jgi:hypothetical protein